MFRAVYQDVYTGDAAWQSLSVPEGDLFQFEPDSTYLASGRDVTVKAKAADGSVKTFAATVRIDTPQEIRYYQHGGILPYVLRQMV